MPQCPHCQAPYEKGQRYCSTCGSFLLHPEEGDSFCPQCGVRVSPRQEFCHECDAPLKGEAAAPLKAAVPEKTALPKKAAVLEKAVVPEKAEISEKAAVPEKAAPPPAEAPGPFVAKEPPPPLSPSPAPPPSPRWLPGLLVGTGIIIIILLILLFTQGTTPPVPTPAPKAEAPAAPALATPAPAAPATEKAAPTSEQELKEQLQGTLSLLREAQLNKDSAKFMSVYSPTFPELDQKRAKTLKAWEVYDFTSLVYTIDKIQPIDPDNAIAWVTWYIDTKNLSSQELTSVSQTYQVRFAKEEGKWRIRGLEEVTP
jgi:hypothetical protein